MEKKRDHYGVEVKQDVEHSLCKRYLLFKTILFSFSPSRSGSRSVVLNCKYLTTLLQFYQSINSIAVGIEIRMKSFKKLEKNGVGNAFIYILLNEMST